MSDLNSALRNALAGWHDDDVSADRQTTPTAQQPAPQPIPASVSQQTFEHVKANPGITTRQAVIDLATMGLNAASTTSLISQMVRTGMCKRDNHQLYTLVKYYRPIQITKKVKHKQVRIVPRPSPDIWREETVTTPVSMPSKPDVTHNITSLLDNISVNEARALYLELKKMFGGS